jgi:hypothetical protein
MNTIVPAAPSLRISGILVRARPDILLATLLIAALTGTQSEKRKVRSYTSPDGGHLLYRCLAWR